MNGDYQTRAEYRHDHNENNQKPKKPRNPLRWVYRVIGLIIVLLCIGGAYEYHKIHSTAQGVFSSGSGKVSKKLREGKPVSVLAMGTDVGALKRGSKGGNTDTLELITINPKKETVTMTSIPRDILIKVDTDEGADYIKLNAAYQIGGAKQTVKQVKELLGVPIDYYAVVNMGVLKKVVNAVGGVDVNNPFAFDYEGQHFAKGKLHLNGHDALQYSRMRYDDPKGDYGRQNRQQQVIKSIMKNFKKSGSISAANKILDAVKDGVKTNIPIDNVATLYSNYHVALNNIKTEHFQGMDATIEGVSFQIASPKEINRVSKLIRNQLGLKAKKVVNNETKMYNLQTTYDGYTNTNFVLPNGASYNTPGSGTSNTISSSSKISSSSLSNSSAYGMTASSDTMYNSNYTNVNDGLTN
ncbi:LCP family protein [Limosilactobacillus mucosae]|uniref:LCP family protein n=1 Tax=Limosilactobacillus mucosae TaxID=97478 RepID=UPI003994B410